MPDQTEPIMRVHLKPCPFCGKAATREWSELNGKEYLSVGCPDFRCRGGHGTSAAPPERWGFEVVGWNTRVGE